MAEALSVRAENLTKRYRSGTTDVLVFSGLNLQVEAGVRLAVVGPSGAGKSTLLHLLGCLDRPTEGRIYLGQHEVSRLGERELAETRNRSIGFVWQMNTLLPEFTALENVSMPLRMRGVAPLEAMRAAEERLEEVGLKDRVHHRPGELSGGEQQRVALARAFVVEPEVLLADEPTGSLDHATGERVMALMFEMNRESGTTLVLVTHDARIATRCDRQLHIEAGRLLPAA